eukprot:365051-Chlamydomonas_euryale.AAC.4
MRASKPRCWAHVQSSNHGSSSCTPPRGDKLEHGARLLEAWRTIAGAWRTIAGIGPRMNTTSAHVSLPCGNTSSFNSEYLYGKGLKDPWGTTESRALKLCAGTMVRGLNMWQDEHVLFQHK